MTVPYSSRVEPHARSCAALCSKCFDVANQSASTPPLTSRLIKSHDLSVQHSRTCRFWNLQDKQTVSDLCSSCGDTYRTDGAYALVRIREQREEGALRRTLTVRNLSCQICTRPLDSSKKWRWMCINGVEKHECRWAGHELLSQT